MTDTRQHKEIGMVSEMYPSGILMGHTYTYPQAVAKKKFASRGNEAVRRYP